MIPLQEINKFLASYGWIIAVAIAVILALTIVIILLVNKNKKATSGGVIELVGGEDNVIESNLKGSRLTLLLKDKKLINNEELHKIGVISVIETGDKTILVLNSKAKKDFVK